MFAARDQSILEYNGAAMLAMTGKNCVGICSDSRLGNQAQTVATDFEKIFKMGDQLMVCACEDFRVEVVRWCVSLAVSMRSPRYDQRST